MILDDIEATPENNGVKVRYGVQTIFSTIPNQKNINFEDDVKRNYFDDYKSKIGKDDYLYQPLKYYMLGDYDVCYISLINNFKFSHRLFEPKDKVDDTVYNAHSFQSFSGFALDAHTDYREIFKEGAISSYFIGIINLKLNNGLLIGNGLKFVDAVKNRLRVLLGETDFLLSQTFSWFELSLVVFINDPKELAEILSKIRVQEFKDLDQNDLQGLGDSLYHSLLNDKREMIDNISLFADTNSFFGFNEKLINGKLTDQYVKNFEAHVKENDIILETEIEWQVKPGHLLHLESLLQGSRYLKKYFDFDDRKVVLGKCDYLLKEVKDDIMANFHLIRHIKRKDSCNLYDHIRKVRTYMFLNGTKFSGNTDRTDFFCWDKELDKLAVKSRAFNKIDKELKSLKISRQVRIKILKIFSNYNNGIQDPILFPYFLDFTIFIRDLIQLIHKESKKAEGNATSIKELETALNEHIKVFQEGYNVRFLNAYQFENISDFDLDFNSSIQQLLTSYGTLVYEYGKLFYFQPDKPYGPLIQLNNIDTNSNYRSINYAIHHLTSPEFVFSTLLKEILNHLRIDNIPLREKFNNLDKGFKVILENINESYLDDMVENKLIDLDYLIIDSIRFIITFNGDFKLFEHWFWSYNFQNPSLFDTSGMFNEEHLRKEMLRILLVKYIFSLSDVPQYPAAELFTYWDRHFIKLDKIALLLVNELKAYDFMKVINSVVYNYLENYPDKKSKPTGEVFTYMEKFDRLANIKKDVKTKQIVKLSAIFKQLNNRPTDIFQMDKIIFDTLNHQYEQNLEKVTLLKRDWEKGTVLSAYNELNKDILYAIDQTGGVYFYDNKKTNSYFWENAECLLSLINFSMIKKKDFILEQQNDA